jgi:hypothetical protein
MSLATKRTIYGNGLQTAMFNNKEHEILNNTTLNEKFQVLATDNPDKMPTLAYYAIGRGGHKNYSGSDGQPLVKSRPHRARDAALFKHLPFVMRELDNDLDALTRNNYALRVIENFNNVDYYCYYLKRVPASSQALRYEHSVTTDGVTETVVFQPTPADLNPVPVDIPSEGVTPGTGETLSVSTTFEIDFNATDSENLKQVCRIRHNDEQYATVSEIAICSGQDHGIDVQPQSGNAYVLREARGVQVSIFVSCMYPMAFANNGFNLKIDLGASEPLAVGASGNSAASPLIYTETAS